METHLSAFELLLEEREQWGMVPRGKVRCRVHRTIRQQNAGAPDADRSDLRACRLELAMYMDASVATNAPVLIRMVVAQLVFFRSMHTRTRAPA